MTTQKSPGAPGDLPSPDRFTWLCGYVIEFTVCALCGWLYEEGLELAVNHAYADRGLLHLPLLPIYGFGGLLVIFLFRKRNHWLWVFGISTLATTVLELAASYPIEHILGYLPWYYGAWPLNFEGRISVLSSLIFGALALLLVKAVHPLCRWFAKRPVWLVRTLGLLLGAVLLADTVWTFWPMLRK